MSQGLTRTLAWSFSESATKRTARLSRSTRFRLGPGPGGRRSRLIRQPAREKRSIPRAVQGGDATCTVTTPVHSATDYLLGLLAGAGGG